MGWKNYDVTSSRFLKITFAEAAVTDKFNGVEKLRRHAVTIFIAIIPPTKYLTS